MKIITLACPFCSAALEVRSDYRYAECPYCGQKVLMCEDESERADSQEQEEYNVLFDNAVHYLQSGDDANLWNISEQMISESPENPDGWFFKGCVMALQYAIINDCEYNGDEEFEFHDLMKELTSSWTRAFKYISDDDRSPDYPICIGYSFGEISSTGLEDEEVEALVNLANDLLYKIPENVGFMYTTEYYYMIYMGMADVMKVMDPVDRDPYLLETIFLNSLMLDSDLGSVLYKIDDIFGLDESLELDIDYAEPLNALYNAVSESIDGMPDSRIESLMESWPEDVMYDQLADEWNALFYPEMPTGITSMFKKSPNYDELAKEYVNAFLNGPIS